MMDVNGSYPFIIPVKRSLEPSNVIDLTRGGRCFLNPIKRTWWQRFLQHPQQYELLVFSKKTVQDLPSQFPYPMIPSGLDLMARHQWRVEHGYSYVTERLREELQDK